MATDVGVVLVHGLWHGAWAWASVQDALAERGIESVAVELPLTSLAADMAATTETLEKFGRPAVLVGHSYGGAVITDAGTHRLVTELVYLAAFQLDAGESVSRNVPGRTFAQTRLGAAMHLHEDTGEVDLDPVLGPQLLYSDVPAEVAVWAAAQLRPVHRHVFRGVPTQIAWRKVPSTYVVCSNDQVIHPDLQAAMAARATRRIDWPCGHSPALARPAAVGELLASLAAAEASRRRQSAESDGA